MDPRPPSRMPHTNADTGCRVDAGLGASEMKLLLMASEIPNTKAEVNYGFIRETSDSFSVGSRISQNVITENRFELSSSVDADSVVDGLLDLSTTSFVETARHRLAACS
ncbi:hypothetical protein AXG93_3410s1040 [Marchantia polymorpha subsp. ruderalis]|uniref:Uncharacterized protein n=1 Tax=Marchantia polymorpha subsp. ruderalis TaxID=1480154 RepID=A0A176W662_MARPO|nr:hypothetical protein AXG93_3410s1040 [Marchantia polymorpha subsp. ruderalis]